LGQSVNDKRQGDTVSRFKNFDGESGPREAVELTANGVRVTTASYANTEKMIMLRQKNQKFLAPWTARPKNSSHENYVFEVYAQGILVGQIVLWGFQRDEGMPDTCSISYWVDEDNNGKGIATNAVALTASHVFESLGIQILEAPIQPHNSASIKVVSKLNFRKTKTIVNYLEVDGKARNHEIYELTPQSSVPNGFIMERHNP
jgi:RimJ/RimL family protein N-acetyltransferase